MFHINIMATQHEIQKVLNALSSYSGCSRCATRIRFGDFECPHCGQDIEDELSWWAESLINDLREMDDNDNFKK